VNFSQPNSSINEASIYIQPSYSPSHAPTLVEQSITDTSFSDPYQFQHIEMLLHSNENSLIKYEEYVFNKQQSTSAVINNNSSSSSDSSGMAVEMERSSDKIKEDQIMPSTATAMIGTSIMPTIQERNLNNSTSADSTTFVSINYIQNDIPNTSSSFLSTTTSSFNLTGSTAVVGSGSSSALNPRNVVQKALHFASKIFSSRRSDDNNNNNNNHSNRSSHSNHSNNDDNSTRSQQSRQFPNLESQQLVVSPTDNQITSHDLLADKRLEAYDGRMNHISTETIDTLISSTSNDLLLHSPSLIVDGAGAITVSPMPPPKNSIPQRGVAPRVHNGRTIVQSSKS